VQRIEVQFVHISTSTRTLYRLFTPLFTPTNLLLHPNPPCTPIPPAPTPTPTPHHDTPARPTLPTWTASLS